MAVQETHRLIKAHAARGLGVGATFNYDDLRRQCEEHVAQARRDAEELLAQTRLEAEQIRRRAHEAGLAAGQQEGLATAQHLIEARASELADRRVQEQVRSLLPAFQAAVAAMHVERDRWLAHWEEAAVRLSAAIAEKVIRHELERRPELSVEIVREALQLAAGTPHIRLRMHPDDVARLNETGRQMIETLAQGAEAALVADPQVSPGGCVIETRHGVIDGQIETQLERISRELLAAS